MSELENEVARMANNAIETFQERASGALDFSQESLQVIEDLLEEASDFYPEIPPERAENIVQMIGCYILEVARKEFGGEYFWHDDRNQPVLAVGEPDYHIAIMTWDKVRGRLSGDPADDIPFFYSGFADRVRSAKPGIRALYV